MVNIVEDQYESHASDIISVPSYEAEKPKKKDFLPWHKPRKHFVRQKQWLCEIRAMIEEVMPEDNVLKYLGLPGDDLLDLRYFHQTICEPKNLKLRFLGFNYGANSKSNRGTELFVSLDEVSKLELVDPSSDIIGDNIAQIGNTDSIAWNRSKKMGPYDVINIDLCDGFGKEPLNQFQATHYSALAQIMGLQSRRHNPWLLFLTTRTGTKHTDEGVLNILKGLYEKNLGECPQFQAASQQHYKIQDSISLNAATQTSKGTSDVFLVSLCKWIACMGLGQQPPAKIKVKSVLGYTVEEEAEHKDLISIAIKIEPTFAAANDRIGLAQVNGVAIPSECEIAVQALNRIAKQKDVDHILEQTPAVLQQMISETSILLEQARYDISGYAAWSKTRNSANALY